MSYPSPPALRIRYAAMPSSAETSCTTTPFRPTFVAFVSISSLALHIRLHPLSCRSPRLPRAVLLDWIRRCQVSGYESHRPPSLIFILSSPSRPVSLLGLRGGRIPPSPRRLPYSRHARDARTIHNPTTYDIQRHTIYSWVPPSAPARSRRRGVPSTSRPPHSFFRRHVDADDVARRHQIYISRGYAREDAKGRGGGLLSRSGIGARGYVSRLLPIVRTNRICCLPLFPRRACPVGSSLRRFRLVQ
ncbi:hypothetical protein B0H14DRAFT_2829253 [Mycena olivaceomarginata]|nr:hypothetical protein B0H14DRAFT_2829253 [Mycena olivaceomarginata]